MQFTLILLLTLSLAWNAPAPAPAPLANTGTCPELVRIPHELPERFLNNTDDILLKKFPGTIQAPLSPAQSINCVQTPSGFRAELWASEETPGNIKAVQSFTFDERGRMWALETFDYPNIITAPFAGHDRIIILEDTDGDGVANKHLVFAEGLNIPQGIEWTPQGLVVAMAPYLLLFEDKDGDDKADLAQGKILYQGFNKVNPGDTHAGISNLHYNIDNWIYGMCGYGGGEINGVKLSQGFWRARLDGTKFEYLAKTNNNSWGVGIIEDGQVFGSTANATNSVHYVMPGLIAQRLTSEEWFHPITKDVNQGDFYGMYTGASNHDMYTSRLFPKEYWSRAGFVCEGTGHLVGINWINPKGSTWITTHDSTRWNIYASKDAWSAPIMAKTGPDGAVWILDWYSALFLHNGAGPTGPGGAYLSDLRNKQYCRIYRIVPSNGKLENILDLSKASLNQLIATFANPNLLWRMQAQKILIKKAMDDKTMALTLIPLLESALKSRIKDAIGNDPVCLHALWTLQGMGLFEKEPSKWNPVLKTLLLHPSASIRMNVIKAMPRSRESSLALMEQGRVNDPDAHVRLQALLMLAAIPDKVEGISLFRDFRKVDDWNPSFIFGQPKWADTAFSKAGIQDRPDMPILPELQSVALSQPRIEFGPTLRSDLRFVRGHNGGFAILTNYRLQAGELFVYDLVGTMQMRITYDGQKWLGDLRLLRDGVYRFLFRSTDGSVTNGLIR
jgi:uncharacterized protein